MLFASAIIEVILASLVGVPLLIYRLRAKRWQKLPLEYPRESCALPLVIILPIWNEALVIEKKLTDLTREYQFKTSLLVIDSASTDNSVELAEQWLKDNPSAFSSSRVVVMPERLGKTAAVKLAIDDLSDNSFEGLILMTDADALITAGTIHRLHGWFADASIGVVGSSAVRKTSLHGESNYRSLYEFLRVAESKVDSTPFLEGSCMMWRHGSFNSSDLNIASNADDAQIASLVRLSGLKSIHDMKSSFVDFAPTTIDGQRRQKIRRAQGLQNMLEAQSKHPQVSEHGEFSKILKMQYYLHCIAPLILFQLVVTVAFRWSYVTITGMPVGFAALTHAVLALCELIILTSWLTHRNGIRLPFVAFVGTLATSFEYLFIAKYRNLQGRQSNIWDQHEDVRKLLKEF